MDHHYVPKFLLRAWAVSSPDNMLQEFRIDLPGVPSRRRAPKATGFQEDLYALTFPVVAGMGQQDVETLFLQRIDDDAARARKKMVEQGLTVLKSAEKSDWTRFLISMRLRQPALVNQLKIESQQHLKAQLATHPDEYDNSTTDAGEKMPTTLEEWTEQTFPGLIENFGLSFFHKIVTDQARGEQIFRLRWWICDLSEGKHELLLSDNPCLIAGALDAEEFAMALPLSPWKAFLATRGDRTASRLRRTPPTKLAMQLNETSIWQASERVYARTNAPKRFIENRSRSRAKPTHAG